MSFEKRKSSAFRNISVLIVAALISITAILALDRNYGLNVGNLGSLGRLGNLSFPETEFSPQFSKSKFHQITKGMGMADVERLIGKPLHYRCFSFDRGSKFKRRITEEDLKEYRVVEAVYSRQVDQRKSYTACWISYDDQGLSKKPVFSLYLE